MIGVIVCTLSLIVSLVIHFRSKWKDREAAKRCRCNSCEDADCPSNVCPVHPEKARARTPPPPPPVRPPTRTSGADMATRDYLARDDHVHTSAMFAEMDRTMREMGEFLNTTIPQTLDGMGELMRTMGHLQEDLQLLRMAGIRSDDLRGLDSRPRALQHLRRHRRIPDAVYVRMSSWRDHDNLPNWVEMMGELLSSGSTSNSEGLFSVYTHTVLSGYTPTAATERPAQAPTAEPKPEKAPKPPSRFEREDIL